MERFFIYLAFWCILFLGFRWISILLGLCIAAGRPWYSRQEADYVRSMLSDAVLIYNFDPQFLHIKAGYVTRLSNVPIKHYVFCDMRPIKYQTRFVILIGTRLYRDIEYCWIRAPKLENDHYAADS